MTEVERYWIVSISLVVVFVLICASVGYVVLSTGLVDSISAVRRRPDKLARVKAAAGSIPPDIALLTDALDGVDWFVAAVAAERIGQLRQSNKLEPGQVDIAVRSLFEALGSGGHWWRFGWDRDEAEFGQFRGAASEAAARFGSKTLSELPAALSSDNPFKQEAACWIVIDLLRSNAIEKTTLIEYGVGDRVENLAKNDLDSSVKAACMAAQDMLARTAYEE